jgi:hypothetical protein
MEGKIKEEKPETPETPQVKRVKAAAAILATVTHSNNDMYGEWERSASYLGGAKAGLTEGFMIRLIKAAMRLRARGGISGASDEIPD